MYFCCSQSFHDESVSRGTQQRGALSGHESDKVFHSSTTTACIITLYWKGRGGEGEILSRVYQKKSSVGGGGDSNKYRNCRVAR